MTKKKKKKKKKKKVLGTLQVELFITQSSYDYFYRRDLGSNYIFYSGFYAFIVFIRFV
jgi:hypothetical protein